MFNSSVTFVNTNTTLTTDYDTYLVSATGSNITITLPLATINGMNFNINRIDTNTLGNTVFINSSGGQQINNAGTSAQINSTTNINIQAYNNAWYTYPASLSAPPVLARAQMCFNNTGTNTSTAANTIGVFGAIASVPPFSDTGALLGQTGTVSNFFVRRYISTATTPAFRLIRNEASNMSVILNIGQVSNGDTSVWPVTPGSYISINKPNSTVPTQMTYLYTYS